MWKIFNSRIASIIIVDKLLGEKLIIKLKLVTFFKISNNWCVEWKMKIFGFVWRSLRVWKYTIDGFNYCELKIFLKWNYKFKKRRNVRNQRRYIHVRTTIDYWRRDWILSFVSFRNLRKIRNVFLFTRKRNNLQARETRRRCINKIDETRYLFARGGNLVANA